MYLRNAEPTVEELLDDPIADLLMARDRLQPEQVGAYQRLPSENGGNPATAGGTFAASMTPGGATSPVPAASGASADVNAPPGPAGTYLARLASFESGGDPNAKNPKSSA